MKRKLSLILALLMAASACSCGGTEPVVSDDTTVPEDSPETTVDTSLRENTPDTLPELDFEGETIRILFREGVQNDVQGGELAGDVVDDAVYNRNLSVEERLNVTFEYIRGNSKVETFTSDLRTVITAGDDAYDIVHHAQYEHAQLSLEGLYRDLIDAPYIDYDQPWWTTDYMDIIQFNPKERFFVLGDITFSQISSASATFVNKNLFEDNFGSMDDFYDMILDGGWTYDVMRKYISDAYKDLNADGIADLGDILGMGTTVSGPTEHFAYSAGAKYFTRDKDGYPEFLTDMSRNVKVFEAMYRLHYETEGTFVSTDPYAINNELPQKFIDGTQLFLPNTLGTVSKYRDMKDPYGIIPRPKLDDTQKEYLSLVHDGVSMYAVPVTTPKFDEACAVLEALCAEGYRKVTPAYYETALKMKYAQDDVSVQIIELIHDTLTTDFIYAYNYCFDVNLGTISRQLMKNKSSDFMSLYASMKPAIQAKLDQMIADAKAK